MTKNSKRSIILSAVLVIAMCLSLMAAGTYAWFTDTATVNVNKIVSGTLDVALYMQGTEDDDASWTSAEGKTLNFLKMNAGGTRVATDSEAVKWEPGATYETQKLKVVNEGNLALKFKIVVSNVDGDDKLNEVITWQVVNKNSDVQETVEISTMEYVLVAPNGENGDAYYFSLRGHMDENAGNEYQGLSIDNIAITVYATQASDVEYDSYDKIYDRNATYSANIEEKVTVTTNKNEDTGVFTVAEDKTYKSANTVTVNGTTLPAATVTIPTGVVVENENATLTLTVTEQNDVDSNVTVNAGETATTYEIKVDGVKTEGAMEETKNTTPLAVTFYVGTGLYNPTVYHGGSAMLSEDVGKNNTYSYNSTTGMMTIYTSSFSKFTIVNSGFKFENGEVTTVVGTIKAIGWQAAIYACNGSKITVNADVTAVLNADGRAMAIRADKEGTEIYITGGNYSQTKGDNTEFITEGYTKTTVPDPYDLIYAHENGKIYISGGTFKCAMPRWTLNCKDSDNSTITVSGGSFYKFNPAFTAVNDTRVTVEDGYVVLKVSEDWYEVVKEGDARLAYATKYTGTKNGNNHGSAWYVANGVSAELEAYYGEDYHNSLGDKINKYAAIDATKSVG